MPEHEGSSGTDARKFVGTRTHVFPAWLSFQLNNPLRRHFRPPKRIIEALSVKGTDVVLDFGCGPGFYTIPLAEVAKEVVAVDIQPKMLAKMSRYAEKRAVNVKPIQSDGTSIPLPDKYFDLVFLNRVYHEVADKRSVLTELGRLLKTGGRIVISEKTKSGRASIGSPQVNANEVFVFLKATGFRLLGEISPPNDRSTTLIVATRE